MARVTTSLVILFVVLVSVITGPARAQDASASASAPAFSTEQLEQFVAPIALYPDDLVSQILMASTYPLEVVQADRWSKANPSVSGTALETALDGQTWDPSVKSLVNFPDVLDMMSQKLDWMTDLGNAFIAQQADVLAAVQRLREKANDEGNLESNQQQTVTVQPATSTQSQTIIIQSADPQVVYVPTYNPTVVYGTWPYPAYPPYSYYPPGYVASTAAVSFGVGLACGAAWGYAWGDCDWHGGDIDVDVNRNANFNRNISETREFRNERNRNGTRWEHDGNHRRGASYRDRDTAERFGRSGSRDAARAREEFRGRAERDRGTLSRDQRGRRENASSRQGTQRGRREDASSRQRTQRDRSSASGGRRGSSEKSAFDRSRSGRSTREASNRGRSSRSSGARSGGSRGGSRGGGHRGGSRGGGRRR